MAPTPRCPRKKEPKTLANDDSKLKVSFFVFFGLLQSPDLLSYLLDIHCCPRIHKWMVWCGGRTSSYCHPVRARQPVWFLAQGTTSTCVRWFRYPRCLWSLSHEFQEHSDCWDSCSMWNTSKAASTLGYLKRLLGPLGKWREGIGSALEGNSKRIRLGMPVNSLVFIYYHRVCTCLYQIYWYYLGQA